MAVPSFEDRLDKINQLARLAKGDNNTIKISISFEAYFQVTVERIIFTAWVQREQGYKNKFAISFNKSRVFLQQSLE